jgi:hypothetical protein
VEHAPGFSAGVGLWVGVVCSSPERRPTFSENPGKILGKSWENPGRISSSPKIMGVICRKFWEILASFAGASITPRERCHVTQPRARINVSCSRAGRKGAKGPQKEGQRRVGTRPAEAGCQTRVPNR